jgi:NAD(P)-dependent dehydrogenase (short-subunit alcohol dehydrogenase family)
MKRKLGYPPGMGVRETDRVWFITGSGSGLGRELAEATLDAGDSVVATGRDPSELQALEKRVPDRVLVQKLDVTAVVQVEAAVAAAIDRFGRIDVLVNNAGFGLFGPLEELTDEELRREFDTNVFGAVNVIRAALPWMRSKRSGHIVQISSLEGVAPVVAGEAAYAGTKFAIEGICETLAKDVEHLGIGVTIVEPGPIRTDFASGSVAKEPLHPDYKESVGKALEWYADLAGKQPNDPRRVAEAIMEGVAFPEPPLRLALGEEAVQAIREKLERQSADLDRWDKVAASTAVPA